MVHRRNYVWEPDHSWLQNAHQEHARVPFHAILARANSNDHPNTLIAGALGDATALWAVPRGVTIARNGNEMAAAVVGMLRIAEVVIFVDPYFRPAELKNRRPLEAFLRAVMAGRPMNAPSRVEVHTSLKYENAPTAGFFLSECERRLPRCVPSGVRLSIRVLSQRTGGEQLHNRYILTDVGGLTFGTGLDDGAEGETDDVSLMDRLQYELRWSQHAAEPMAFDVTEVQIEIQSGR